MANNIPNNMSGTSSSEVYHFADSMPQESKNYFINDIIKGLICALSKEFRNDRVILTCGHSFSKEKLNSRKVKVCPRSDCGKAYTGTVNDLAVNEVTEIYMQIMFKPSKTCLDKLKTAYDGLHDLPETPIKAQIKNIIDLLNAGTLGFKFIRELQQLGAKQAVNPDHQRYSPIFQMLNEHYINSQNKLKDLIKRANLPPVTASPPPEAPATVTGNGATTQTASAPTSQNAETTLTPVTQQPAPLPMWAMPQTIQSSPPSIGKRVSVGPQTTNPQSMYPPRAIIRTFTMTPKISGGRMMNPPATFPPSILRAPMSTLSSVPATTSVGTTPTTRPTTTKSASTTTTTTSTNHDNQETSVLSIDNEVQILSGLSSANEFEELGNPDQQNLSKRKKRPRVDIAADGNPLDDSQVPPFKRTRSGRNYDNNGFDKSKSPEVGDRREDEESFAMFDQEDDTLTARIVTDPQPNPVSGAELGLDSRTEGEDESLSSVTAVNHNASPQDTPAQANPAPAILARDGTPEWGLIDALKKKKTKIYGYIQRANVNTFDKEGNTPLHYAVRYKKSEAIIKIRALVERGANVNAQNTEGQTPLFWAARDGKDMAVKLLLELGASKE